LVAVGDQHPSKIGHGPRKPVLIGQGVLEAKSGTIIIFIIYQNTYIMYKNMTVDAFMYVNSAHLTNQMEITFWQSLTIGKN
jgi:hypothetical protein